MPPYRIDSATSDADELASRLGGISPVIQPVAPEEAPPPPADHVLLADEVVRNSEDATPSLVGLVFRLGWPPERVQSAVEAGISAGILQSWPGSPAGPSVTLTAVESKRRGVRIRSGGVAKGGRFLFRWVDIDADDPQAKGGMRLADKTKIALTAELRYGGNAKTRPSKVPTLEKLAKYNQSAHDYLVAAEYLESHPREMAKAAGPNVLQGKASSGAIFTGSGATWPDPAQVRYEEPGRSPSDPGPKESCPVCLGNEPSLAGYCLRCDRSGVDHVLPATEPLPKEQPPRRGPDKKPRKRRGQGSHGHES